MAFNSFVFATFLLIVFSLYWSLPRNALGIRNAFLLIASYVFYGWWDWHFLGLILLNSTVDYFIGRSLYQTQSDKGRKTLLGISLAINLGILGFFKYYDFFIDSTMEVLQAIGLQANFHTLAIILPVGISFYTFQTLSYTIDIYRGKIVPTHNVIAYFAFVSFFPQLVAGPIERASHLLPQFLQKKNFNLEQAKDGLRQILWGLFKKTVIADNLAPYVDKIFSNYETYPGPMLLLGTVYFSVQIYCDFSGYSDMAIGTARLFGFDLKRNFAYPYFSRDIGEFWRRWHISLSTWFRDYVYIPLGGNRTSTTLQHFSNVILTFTISGFWHGANWTFVIWGFLNGLYYLPPSIRGPHKHETEVVAMGRLFPTALEFFQICRTFVLISFAWIFFRSTSFSHAIGFITHIGTSSWLGPLRHTNGIWYVLLIFVIDWIQRDKLHPLEIATLPRYIRWGIYYIITTLILLVGKTGHVPFIYFQF